MYRFQYFCLFIGFILGFQEVTHGQEVDYFVINDIIMEGNNKTKPYVVSNELDFKIGDTLYLDQLASNIESNQERLYSTALFTDVNINVKNWSLENKRADIVITFQENWYIYPSIIFELADRNFNVWWKEQNRDFGRVNYGVGLDHINFTGNKDKLRFKFQHGYTRKYELKYNFPYISRRWGVFGEIFYANQKEIGYKTIENKTVFEKLDDERILLKRFRTGLGINYRHSVFAFHDFKLEYHHNSIDDYVAQNLNPDYFLNAKDNIRFFSIKYDFTYDRRIFNLYPQGGYMLSANIVKEGIGIFGDFDNLSIALGVEKHQRIGNRLLIGTRLRAKTNLIRSEIAFANNTGLGYGNDIVRGYELYVVDGPDYILSKSSIRYNLLSKDYQLGKYMFLKQFKKMNFKMFVRVNFDMGYVNEPTARYRLTNDLNNRLLIGYGPAFDILLYHTYILSVEYSFNHLAESGLFVSANFNF